MGFNMKKMAILLAFPMFMVSAQSPNNVIIGIEKPRGVNRVSNHAQVDQIVSTQEESVQLGTVDTPITRFSEPSPFVEEKKKEGILTDLDYFYPPANLEPSKPSAQATVEPVSAVSAKNESQSGFSFNDSVTDNTKSLPPITQPSVPVVAPITPTITEPKQHSLYGTSLEYLIVPRDTDRVYVSPDDGRVHFHAETGSLKSNVEALLAATNTAMPLVWEVSEQHFNPTDIWMTGDTVLDVLDQLLLSYNEPHPIKTRAWVNRIVEVYYDTKNRRGM